MEIELRVWDDDASKYLEGSPGRVAGNDLLGHIRVIRFDTESDLGRTIAERDRQSRASGGRRFLISWTAVGSTPAAFKHPGFAMLEVVAAFEPAGEECGTVYSKGGCPVCYAGEEQVGPLILDLRHRQPGRDIDSQTVPRSDIARTIADEIIVSGHLAAELELSGLTGFSFGPVYQVGRPEPVSNWKQLLASGPTVPTVPPTRFGVTPLDPDEPDAARCVREGPDHVAGLNLISDLTMGSTPETDLALTTQFVGDARGLLRPARIIVASPRLVEVLRSAKVRGVRLFSAHIADA